MIKVTILHTRSSVTWFFSQALNRFISILCTFSELFFICLFSYTKPGNLNNKLVYLYQSNLIIFPLVKK